MTYDPDISEWMKSGAVGAIWGPEIQRQRDAVERLFAHWEVEPLLWEGDNA